MKTSLGGGERLAISKDQGLRTVCGLESPTFLIVFINSLPLVASPDDVEEGAGEVHAGSLRDYTIYRETSAISK